MTGDLTATTGYRESDAAVADRADAAKAIEYKVTVARNYISLTPEQIDGRLGGTTYIVTRKYDGEMNVLFFDGERVHLINRSGRLRAGLACAEDARAALVAADVTQAVIPVELYLDETAGRTRVFQVLAALADPAQTGALRLAAFDLLELNGAPYTPTSYADTHATLTRILATARLCTPVKARPCRSKAEVKQTYAEWVDGEGAEGLVVRTELPLVYKIKPRHTLDVAVVGYSEGTDDLAGGVRSLLLALMPGPGEFQVIGKTGGGFGEDMRRTLLERLQAMTVPSAYIEADSNHVAFHMVRPEVVIELMVNDVLFETVYGVIENPVLTYDGTYAHRATVQGISLVSPVFVRVRDDKRATHEDVRLTQINDFAYAAPADLSAPAPLPASTLLRREVYVKEAGGKLMVLKFMAWRTNKPAPVYPAYVFHLTNYSSDRKDPLQREVAITDDEAQLTQIFDAAVADNVKRGWVQQG